MASTVGNATSGLGVDNVGKPGFGEVERARKKSGPGGVSGYHRHVTSRPDIIKFYSDNMGGVDSADQMIAEYGVQRASKRWYASAMYRAIDIAVVNAYILHRLALDLPQTGQLEFRTTVVDQLLAAHGKGHVASPEVVREMGGAAAAAAASAAQEVPARPAARPGHYPEPRTVQEWGSHICYHCDLAQRDTTTERLEHRRATMYCAGCDRYFCCKDSRNCFRDFHVELERITVASV